MKIFLILTLVFSSSLSFAQTRFKVSDYKNRISDLAPYKTLHQQILRSYKSQIDSIISRLATGIEYESGIKNNKLTVSLYERMLVKLLVKRVFINELQKQIAPIDLNKYAYNKKGEKVFKTEKLKI